MTYILSSKVLAQEALLFAGKEEFYELFVLGPSGFVDKLEEINLD
jgi:hypothetical protein